MERARTGGGANARCINLFTGPGGVPGANAIPGVTRYVIDFSGDVLAGLDRSSGVDAITDLPAQDVLLKVVGPVSGLDRVARHHGCAHQGAGPEGFPPVPETRCRRAERDADRYGEKLNAMMYELTP
jgi:hypothetical protein